MAISETLKTAFLGKPESCEACGASFECGRMLGGLCWCAKEKLSKRTLAKLKENHSRCLCPECLRTAERQSNV